jgi:cysteine desulfurase family protein
MVYFDNAATSFPKPRQVVDAIGHFLTHVSGSAGRSGHHLSVEAGRTVYSAREALAELLHVDDPLRIVFGHNVTEALNLALKGLLRPGNHVITSSVEHNSVMRPLRVLERHGVKLTVVCCSKDGTLDPRDVERAIGPATRLIVLNHASNVIGTLLPVREVSRIARKSGLLLLVDAAQTAGCYPIDVDADGIDLLAFTGHKGLLGPTGTGGLVIGPRVPLDEFEPLMEGGTGSRSELEEQPDFLPDKFEGGTANAAGLAGLAAGVRFVLERGVTVVREHERRLTELLINGLASTASAMVYGPQDASRQTATVSFNLAGLECSETALRLDDEFGILCRPGLHCSPATHRTIGTFPAGTVRFSLGVFNTEEEVARAVEAIRILSRRAD